MNTGTYLTVWLALRSAELRPRTIESYRDLIDRYISPSIGGFPVEQLQPDCIRNLLAQIAGTGKTRTAELVYVMLKAAFADLEPCPMRRIKRPAHVQRSPDAWSDDHIRAYLSALESHRHGLSLSMGIIMGLRRGEICGLRWSDIDFSDGTLSICNQRQRMATGEIVDCAPKSASSVRILPIPDGLLLRLRHARQLGGYICSLTPSGLDAAHRALVVRLGLPYIPLHGLRHSMATACIRHGGDMRSLQSLLGHASYATTANRYTHPDRDMLRKAIDLSAASCYY